MCQLNSSNIIISDRISSFVELISTSNLPTGKLTSISHKRVVDLVLTFAIPVLNFDLYSHLCCVVVFSIRITTRLVYCVVIREPPRFSVTP